MINTQQLNKIRDDKGFIAALDQSGGSTPKALKSYGVNEADYTNEDEMFDLVHTMRTRIITSAAFTGERILGAILFKETMERQILGKDTADYLWNERNIVPFLKIDNGLEDKKNEVSLMKSIPQLNHLLDRANEKNIFGTKMRSVIYGLDEAGIKAVVDQQFTIAKHIITKGLVPIVEPEVNISAENKSGIEEFLKQEIIDHLNRLDDNQSIMLKLTLPEKSNLYSDLIKHKNVIRVAALSGGYSQEEANSRLAANYGMTASFSRALAEGLSVSQSQEEFDTMLKNSIEKIYNASIT